MAAVLVLAGACVVSGGGAGGADAGAGLDLGPASRADEWVTLSDFRHVTTVSATEAAAYLGTTAGLERYDTLRQRWLAPVTVADGLPDDRITALAAEPAGGAVWIGTGRGVARFVPFTGEVERVAGPPPVPVDEVWIDPLRGAVYAHVGGAWWSGSAGSPYLSRSAAPPAGVELTGSTPASRVDPRAVPWSDPLWVSGPAAPGRIFRLTAVARDFRGDWFVATWGDNGRLWSGSRGTWEPLYFGLAGPPGGPMARATDGYWFAPGAARDAAFQARLTALPRSLSAEVALGDPAPVALAHASPGLERWTYAIPGVEPGLDASFAHAALALGDTLWLGTDAGLVRGVAGAWRTWGPVDGPSAGEVLALAADGPDLWVGARDGLTRWRRAAGVETGRWLQGRRVTAVAVAPDVVFAGTDAALWMAARDPAGTEGFAPVQTQGREIRALALGDTLLVVATDWGVEAFDRRSGGWTRVPAGDLRLGGAPRSVAVDGPRVWIGTDRGLARWRTDTGEWERWGPADGLAGVPVLHLLVEPGAVWASTPRGATRYAWRAAEGG